MHAGNPIKKIMAEAGSSVGFGHRSSLLAPLAMAPAHLINYLLVNKISLFTKND